MPKPFCNDNGNTQMKHSKQLTLTIATALGLHCLATPSLAVILDEELEKPVAKSKPKSGEKSAAEIELEKAKKELAEMKRQKRSEEEAKAEAERKELEISKAKQQENSTTSNIGTNKPVSIAIVPFSGDSTNAENNPFNTVISSDLTRSGYFSALNKDAMPEKPSSPEDINFRPWQTLGQDYLVIGQITNNANDYTIQFHLIDVHNGQHLMGYRLTSSASELRRAAHHISDLIYEKLTGNKGQFNRRTVYVTSDSRENGVQQYKLLVAESDGNNPQTVAQAPEQITSPVLSPNGDKLAYIWNGQLAVQTLASGERLILAESLDPKTPPRFSPNGSKIAFIQRNDTHAEIYIHNLISNERVKVPSLPNTDDTLAW